MKFLYQCYGISAMATDVGDRTLVRFAAYIYNTATAIEAVNELVST